MSQTQNPSHSLLDCTWFRHGSAMPVFILPVQNAVAPHQIGVATASSQLFRDLGGTIGIAFMDSEKLALFNNPQNLLDPPNN